MHALVQPNAENWHAHLRLGFRATPSRTVLSERQRLGPLAVQRAFYPEGDLCHVYLLHPPGGVAGGDQIDIQVTAHPGATALLTTPGATKFYRSAGSFARQQQTLTIDSGALEWLPQENILFPGAKVEIETRIHLRGDARFIGWEINCLGRPVLDEHFDSGDATFKFSLFRDELPLLLERMVIDSKESISRSTGLRGFPVFATLCATADDDTLPDQLREIVSADHEGTLAITQVDGLLIARYLGDSTEEARKLFTTLWRSLRPAIIQRPPCEPRIWNT